VNPQSALGLSWSIDEAEWHLFRPNVAAFTAKWRASDFRDYLQESDWKELKSLCEEGFEPSNSAQLFGRTHELLEQGSLRLAFIEGCSAAEVAIYEHIKSKLKNTDEKTIKKVRAFYDLNFPAKLLVTTGSLPGVNPSDLDLAVTAIDIRNKIVHEGTDPKASDEAALRALMRVASKLLPGPPFRFPILPSGNSLDPPETRPTISPQ
jgi:hypothetical protein